jgi:hypothetical protein
MVEYAVMSMAMRYVLLSRHRAKAVSKGVGMEPIDLANIKTTMEPVWAGMDDVEVEAFHSTLYLV